MPYELEHSEHDASGEGSVHSEDASIMDDHGVPEGIGEHVLPYWNAKGPWWNDPSLAEPEPRTKMLFQNRAGPARAALKAAQDNMEDGLKGVAAAAKDAHKNMAQYDDHVHLIDKDL